MPRINLGIILMLLVAVLQSLFVLIVKLLSFDVTISMTVLAYYIIPVLCFLPNLISTRFSLLRTERIGFFCIRSFFATSAVFCFFYAAKNIHLGAAAILFNTTPVFLPILAKIFLNEHTSKQVYLGIFVSLLGVIVVIHPGFNDFLSINSLIGLLSGVLMAVAQLMLRYLAKNEVPAKKIVFYLYFMSSIWAIIFIAMDVFVFNHTSDIIISQTKNIFLILSLLVLLGILSFIAQKILTRAFHCMPVARLVPILYISVPLSSLFGWIGWSQRLDTFFYIGVILVLTGVLLITFEGKITRSKVIERTR